LKVSQDVSNASIGPSTFGPEARDTFAREAHHYVRDYIQLADQKAGLIFTALSALSVLAYNLGLYSIHGLLCWLKPPEKWRFTELIAFLAILINKLQRNIGAGRYYSETRFSPRNRLLELCREISKQRRLRRQSRFDGTGDVDSGAFGRCI
jgi:hypothetical protein